MSSAYSLGLMHKYSIILNNNCQALDVLIQQTVWRCTVFVICTKEGNSLRR